MTETPADVVRRGRARAGLTQRQLADRSGVHQPNIAAIESGRVTPSEQTLARLLDAARVRPLIVAADSRDLIHAVIEAHHGHNPRLFGSVARGDDEVGSDLDLLVDFEPGVDIFDVVDLSTELQERLGVRVDVVSDDGDGPALRHARAEAVPL
ncbi:helix-turn-helix domain-containing protein [Cellulomonas hominis]